MKYGESREQAGRDETRRDEKKRVKWKRGGENEQVPYCIAESTVRMHRIAITRNGDSDRDTSSSKKTDYIAQEDTKELFFS